MLRVIVINFTCVIIFRLSEFLFELIERRSERFCLTDKTKKERNEMTVSTLCSTVFL